MMKTSISHSSIYKEINAKRNNKKELFYRIKKRLIVKYKLKEAITIQETLLNSQYRIEVA